MIDYIQQPDDFTLEDKPVKRHGGILQLLPGQSGMGYGSKITTDRVAVYKGKRYRVYATCYSNVASYWIMVDGQKLHLRGV